MLVLPPGVYNRNTKNIMNSILGEAKYMDFNSIWVRFFGAKPEPMEDKTVSEHLTQERQAGSAIIVPPLSVSEIELMLPREHALNKLCDMRVQRAGGRSRPRLRLEGREDFTYEELENELGRLRRTVTLAADSRLKEARFREAGALRRPDEQKVSQAEQDLRGREKENGPAEQRAEPFGMDALPLIHIAADRLSAWVMVFPPIGKGKELNKELLDDALKTSGVAFGVDEELLKGLPVNRERYFYLFPVAKGRPAHQGKDGYIVEHYDRVVKRKLDMDEHDRIDYASLRFFQSVEKGDVICESVRPLPGDPGRTVLNQVIPAKDGKAVFLTRGSNTEISEDGTKLVASRAGHVEYADEVFQVKSVLEIDENVDYSTGNIKYLGDVHVHGSVCHGFSIRASGDVTVDGVIESGSIEAGGDLIVVEGIAGISRSFVQAKHNIYTKYLKNCVVHAREDLQTDSIVNSEVYSDGEVQVCSGRGVIVGGQIRAAKKVSAKVIGSKSESQTTIFLGGHPYIEYERHEFLELIKKYQKELESLEKRPDSPAKTEHMNQIRLDMVIKRGNLHLMDEEQENERAEVQNQGGCRLVCDTAYPGLVLDICDVKACLNREISKCNARLVDGKIKFL